MMEGGLVGLKRNLLTWEIVSGSLLFGMRTHIGLWTMMRTIWVSGLSGEFYLG